MKSARQYSARPLPSRARKQAVTQIIFYNTKKGSLNLMTSNEQFAANQANAQLSTGPRTEEGKTRSAQNSLQHGVFAKTIVLPGESQEEFDALLAGLHKDHSPVGETESNHVRGLAEIQWRLNRLRRYEAAATDEAFETGNFESKALLNCTLIEQRLLRAFQTTLKLLKDAQAPRLAQRERDLRIACELRQLYQSQQVDWTPQRDGFVFSLREIDDRIHLRKCLEMASKTIKHRFCSDLKEAA
jgi:hypothetical protein